MTQRDMEMEMMQAWRTWADEHGYGEDAYLMTEDDLYDMADAQIHATDEMEMDYEYFGITEQMLAWVRP